ncbi:MAG: hypothetical protein EA422_03620 [Gemmatimonadales bacterium]|nr:MAG: hypothetical protein EA422_03620 [Gemmatimonadales bacterium]
MTRGATHWWMPIGALVVVLLTAPTDLEARQGSAGDDRNRQVNTLWGEASTLADLDATTRRQLAQALANRAELLTDAAEFAIRLGLDHGALRDAGDGVEPTVHSPLYLGIHLALSGRPSEARSHLQRATGLVGQPSASREAWLAALPAGSAQDPAPMASWSHLLDRVGAHRDYCASPPSESLAQGRCLILTGMALSDPETVRRGQRFLESRPIPDHVERVGNNVDVEFHDASTLILLARADWWMMASALDGLTDAQAVILRAMALRRLGRTEEALTLVEGRAEPAAELERAALLAATGRRDEAEELFRSMIGQGGNLAALTLDRASPAGLGGEWALEEFEAQRSLGFAGGSPRSALLLARALIRFGHAAEALMLLEAQYPASIRNDPGQVPPEFLMVMAHVRYLNGRDHYPGARGNLVSLSQSYPSLSGLLTLAQELTAPERTRSEWSRPGP